MRFKVKDDFLMKNIADEFVVIPRGNIALNFNATLVFNQTGAFLWKKMNDFTSVNDLADLLVQEYKIDKELAMIDVEKFVSKLKNNDLLVFQVTKV